MGFLKGLLKKLACACLEPSADIEDARPPPQLATPVAAPASAPAAVAAPVATPPLPIATDETPPSTDIRLRLSVNDSGCVVVRIVAAGEETPTPVPEATQAVEAVEAVEAVDSPEPEAVTEPAPVQAAAVTEPPVTCDAPPAIPPPESPPLEAAAPDALPSPSPSPIPVPSNPSVTEIEVASPRRPLIAASPFSQTSAQAPVSRLWAHEPPPVVASSPKVTTPPRPPAAALPAPQPQPARQQPTTSASNLKFGAGIRIEASAKAAGRHRRAQSVATLPTLAALTAPVAQVPSLVPARSMPRRYMPPLDLFTMGHIPEAVSATPPEPPPAAAAASASTTATSTDVTAAMTATKDSPTELEKPTEPEAGNTENGNSLGTRRSLRLSKWGGGIGNGSWRITGDSPGAETAQVSPSGAVALLRRVFSISPSTPTRADSGKASDGAAATAALADDSDADEDVPRGLAPHEHDSRMLDLGDGTFVPLMSRMASTQSPGGPGGPKSAGTKAKGKGASDGAPPIVPPSPSDFQRLGATGDGDGGDWRIPARLTMNQGVRLSHRDREALEFYRALPAEQQI